MSGISGINAYNKTNQLWNQKNESKEVESASSKYKDTESIKKNSGTDAKTSEWRPVNSSSSLIPTNKDGIGMAIGDVQLSDKAKDYYDKLKTKFGNMQFIAVSADMKDRVKANAAAYGNSSKMIVLIDDAKLEQMANDESFRKKYEGIIAMSQNKIEAAKNSLTSSGANIKNFGMTVNSDGSTSFFATLEKSSKDQAKRIEKKQAEKKAKNAKEKKLAEKKAQEKRLEKIKEDKKSELPDDEELVNEDDKEYIKIEANSIEELIDMVSKFAYGNMENAVMTDAEKALGQNFDFKG